MADPLLEPRLIARLAALEPRARAVVEGLLAGRHRSRLKGKAHEFSGHRPYTVSDDVRFIDWKAFARTERWVVREEEVEANRRVILLLDASASMAFHGPGRPSKARCGAVLLAALAYALLRRGESVGAAVAGGATVPARAGWDRLPALLHLLDGAAPQGRASLSAALEAAVAGEKRGAWVLLASDLWFPDEEIASAFKSLASRGHEAAVLCPLDPWETGLAMDGDFLFRDMESGDVLPGAAQDLRETYRKIFEARFVRLERALAAARTPLVRCDTGRPLEEALFSFMEKVR